MKVNLNLGQSGEIQSLMISPESKEDFQRLQKVKRDLDKHIELNVVDNSIRSEYLRIKITVELLPAYL